MFRRPTRHREVLSVVEQGWRGARECSLALDAMSIPVTHLIKGRLAAELRAIIQPYPLIRMVSVPRVVFRSCMWVVMLWQTLTGRLRWVLMDRERTLRRVSWWCRTFGLTAVLIREREHNHSYALWIGDQPRSFAEVFSEGPCDASRPGV